MYSIDTNIKEAFLASKRKVSLKVEIAKQFTLTDDDIIEMSIISTMGSGDAFTIGNYTKRELDITLVRAAAPLALSNKSIKVWSGVEVNGKMQYFLIGTFQTDANSLSIDRTTVSIKAYDAMRKCKKGALSPKTSYKNKNLSFYAGLLATKLGVELTDTAKTFIANVDAAQKWTMDLEKGGNTIVRTMQGVALALGATAVITNDNKLDFIRIRPKSNITLSPNFYTSFTIDDNDVFTIEGIKLKIPKELSSTGEDVVYSYPSDTIGTSIEIEETKSDLFKDKTKDLKKQLGYISANMLIGKGGALPFTYQGYELECPSLPYVETGDLLSLTTIDDKTYELFVITHELKFAAGAFTSHMKAAIPSGNDINAVETSSGAITGALTIATTKILQVNKLVADNIEATNAKFDDLEVRKANVDELNATKAKIDTLEAKSITTDNLAAKVANINTLTAEDAIIQNISAQVLSADVIKAAVADVGYITADEVNAVVTNSEKIKAIDAEITNIKAETADIALLKASQAAINTLVTGSAEISAASVIQLTSSNAVIEDGFIKDAMIGNISASKINSGSINTNNVRIQGENGNLLIQDNTLQVKDTDNNVRIQMGLFEDNEYNFGVYDEEGNIIFDAVGLGSNIVRDMNIAADANISAGKLDIYSLYEEINNSENDNDEEKDIYTIKASKIYLDEKNATLDVSFKEMTDNLNTVMTDIEVTAEGVELVTSKTNENTAAINTITQNVEGLRNEYNTTKTNVDGLTEFTKTYFEESADGKFIIGKGVGSDYARMVLDTDEIQFVNANNEVTAYFGNDGFATKKGILTEGNLTIGKFAFMPRENGSLDFKKIN